MLPIGRPVLPGPRRTAQLPPPPLPPPSACSRRPTQTAPPPEECDGAGHLASRMTPDCPHPSSGDTAGASPDRTQFSSEKDARNLPPVQKTVKLLFEHVKKG